MKIQIFLSTSAKRFDQRCTFVVVNAILFHFKKIPVSIDECPITGADVLDLLKKRGLGISNSWWQINTLHQAVEELPKTGVFYIFTHDHAMAYVNGKLIDTTPTKTPKRRKISVLEILG